MGIPWLKDIPVLGWAFRATTEQVFKRHLLIAARAEILRPPERATSPTDSHRAARRSPRGEAAEP